VILGGGYKLVSLSQAENNKGQDVLIDANSTEQEMNSLDSAENIVKEEQAEAAKEIYVHVVGAVERPGVYRLPEGARVVDAINKAVAAPDARLDLINLAAPLPDGVQVTVLSKKEYQDSQSNLNSKEIAAPVQGFTGTSFTQNSSGLVGAVGNGSSTGQELININTASQGELETLSGIGPALAGRIIDYRKNTRFLSPEDIRNVSGIGEKRFDQIKDKITVN